jgi:hypothetical protein
MSMTKKEYHEYRAKKQMEFLERKKMGIGSGYFDIATPEKHVTIQNHRMVTMRNKSIPVTLPKIGVK